ncbi:MAG TPA: helix-turn-helix domain-containing protein [Archangium sp.]
MERTSLAGRPCPIARSVDLLGDAWSLLILRDVFLGARRFGDLQDGLGIAPNSLTRRLEALTRGGLLVARPYSQRPLRHEYALTQKGEDVLPVLLALSAWGNRWLAPRGAPLLLVDPRTGRQLDPVVVDQKTRRPLRAGQVAIIAGPGAPRSVHRELRTPRVFASAEVAS